MRAWLLIAGLAAACGDDGGGGPVKPPVIDADVTAPDATPREVIMATQTLQPLELVEGKMFGGPDDYAGIKLSAPLAKIGWNIHGHENGGTQVVYEEFDKMVTEFIFVPSSETNWWLLVRNDGQSSMDVEVRVELYGDMTWTWE